MIFNKKLTFSLLIIVCLFSISVIGQNDDIEITNIDTDSSCEKQDNQCYGIDNISCNDRFDIYFFYSETCPHCQNELKFLHEIENDYPNLHINYLLSKDNFELYKQFAEKYNTTTSGVPRTFIGDKVFVGFTSDSGELEYVPAYKAYSGYKNLIMNEILINLGQEIIDFDDDLKLKFWPFIAILIYLLTYPFLKKTIKKNHFWIAGLITTIIISSFVFIVITPDVLIKNFAQSTPFPLFVFIIALADGFNPCAFTVFIILLSLLTYTKRKKDMLIVGLVFILTSALMYFIFITTMIFVGSWALEKYGSLILRILGIIIISAGVINIKDYFFFGKGFSLTLDGKQKSKVMLKAGKIARSLRDSKTKRTFLLALVATFFFAVFVNLIELGCSAILPAVYMTSLVNSYGSEISILHIFWTIFYSIIYILPLLVILINFIYTFKRSRLTETQGKILKLISGLFMFIFGIIMILRPELLAFG
jgi:thiol-disulfide isomerase/thioredoxin